MSQKKANKRSNHLNVDAAAASAFRADLRHRLHLQLNEQSPVQQQSPAALAAINGTRRIAIDSPISLNPLQEDRADHSE